MGGCLGKGGGDPHLRISLAASSWMKTKAEACSSQDPTADAIARSPSFAPHRVPPRALHATKYYLKLNSCCERSAVRSHCAPPAGRRRLSPASVRFETEHPPEVMLAPAE